jgi:hypothetical protein
LAMRVNRKSDHGKAQRSANMLRLFLLRFLG